MLVTIAKIVAFLALVLLCLYSAFFRLHSEVECISSENVKLEGPPPLGYASCTWEFSFRWKADNASIFLLQTRYEGEWIGGLKEGAGTYTSAVGTKYKGEWQKDKRHGRGEMVLANKHVFKGKWVNDALTCKSGQFDMRLKRLREIEFVTGAKAGPTHITYWGPFLDAKIDGRGVLRHGSACTLNLHVTDGELKSVEVKMLQRPVIPVTNLKTRNMLITRGEIKVADELFCNFTANGFRNAYLKCGNVTELPRNLRTRVRYLEELFIDYNRVCDQLERDASQVRAEPYHFPNDVEKQIEQVKRSLQQGQQNQKVFEQRVKTSSSPKPEL